MVLVDSSEAKAAALKAALPVAGTGATYVLGGPAPDLIFGFTPAKATAIATLLFIALQAAFLAWKWRNAWLDRRAQGAVQT